MATNTAHDWITALHDAYRQARAQRIGGQKFHSLWGSECEAHPNCIWIVHEGRVEHYQWKLADPQRLAEDLVRALLL